jgi:hypothetical protein
MFDIVWCEPFDGYAVVEGITNDLKLVVRWYDDSCDHFTAVVSRDDCTLLNSKLINNIK